MAAEDLYKINEPGVWDVLETPEKYATAKKRVVEWVRSMIIGDYLDTFSRSFVHNLSIYESQSLQDFTIKCALELLDSVTESLGWKANPKTLTSVFGACFLIAVKLTFGLDFLLDRDRYGISLERSISSHLPLSVQQLISLEYDIMRRTDWKGCLTAGIMEEQLDERKVSREMMKYYGKRGKYSGIRQSRKSRSRSKRRSRSRKSRW